MPRKLLAQWSLSPLKPLWMRRTFSPRYRVRFLALAAIAATAAIAGVATFAAYTSSACHGGGVSWLMQQRTLSPSEKEWERRAAAAATAGIPFPLDTDRRTLSALARLAGVNCSDLARGDAAAAARADAFSRSYACTLADAAAAADSLLAIMPCSDLLARGYAPIGRRQPASNDADAFPLAFSLRLHRSAAQAELLLRSVYAPHNIYCVHVDAKAAPPVRAAMRRVASCLPNVHLLEPSEWFVYGGASPLAVDLRCMRLLLDADAASSSTQANAIRWRYFINLAGQELPLRSVGEMTRLLSLYKGTNDVESDDDTPTRHRHERRYWCGGDSGSGGSDRVRPCWWRGLRKREPPPLPFGYSSLYRGSSYGFFSRAFVEWTVAGFKAAAAANADGGDDGAETEVTDSDVIIKSVKRMRSPPSAALFEWLSDTYAPDEHYWASLNRLPDAPGGYAGPEATVTQSRAVVWRGDGRPCRGRYVRDVCVYGAGDVAWLLRRSEPFANKFYYESDPIAVHCLAESVRARAAAESEVELEGGYLESYRDLPQIRAAAAAAAPPPPPLGGSVADRRAPPPPPP